MGILEARHLTKTYGDFTAVDAVDFSISEGEIFGLLGPNGAGKTTTINMLIGLARITSGSVSLDTADYTGNVKSVQPLMGIVPDESNLYEEMDGFHNLCFCAALYGMPKQRREQRARELLDRFDLTEAGSKPFKAYSRGMKRKLTIAAGIIHEPKILFLDEPTTGIDVSSARQIRQMILDLNRQGTTILLTTHYIEEAERLCHRIAFLVRGKIVRTGTINELMKIVEEQTIVQFKLGNGHLHLDKVIPNEFTNEFTELTAETGSDGTLTVRSRVPVDLMPLMRFLDRKHVPVFEAKIIRPSLEDVFVKVTGLEIARMKQEKEKSMR